ncbi:MAG TPA: hypothetical protein PK822_08185 [Bacillota bacterium]|nr:hypothetical protein [Bacillota bacterium]
MENPSLRLARSLDALMGRRAARAVQGLGCELGTITKVFKSNQHTVDRVWVKLDNFKHEIKDPLIADWEVKIEIPIPSRVIKLASPVEPDGMDNAETEYSDLTRFDFHVQEADCLPDTTIKVHINYKDGIKVGDRVLVAPVCGGQDHVILCRLKESTGPG